MLTAKTLCPVDHLILSAMLQYVRDETMARDYAPRQFIVRYKDAVAVLPRGQTLRQVRDRLASDCETALRELPAWSLARVEDLTALMIIADAACVRGAPVRPAAVRRAVLQALETFGASPYADDSASIASEVAGVVHRLVSAQLLRVVDSDGITSLIPGCWPVSLWIPEAAHVA